MHEGERWYPEASVPAYGDVVWGCFPQDEVPGPGPKPRPVLILAARIHRTKAPPWIYVQCAYGTSRLSRRTSFGLRIQNVSALNAARLPQATLFDLDRTRWIPWSERWFKPREGHLSPTIGRLPHDYMLRLEAIRAQRQMFLAQQQASNDDGCDDDEEDLQNPSKAATEGQ